MKINNWSLVGYIAGFGFALFSSIRYFLLYPDTDKALVYTLIGVIICSQAWVYNELKKQSNVLLSLENYLADQTIKLENGGKQNDEIKTFNQ